MKTDKIKLDGKEFEAEDIEEIFEDSESINKTQNTSKESGGLER